MLSLVKNKILFLLPITVIDDIFTKEPLVDISNITFLMVITHHFDGLSSTIYSNYLSNYMVFF